MRGRKRQRKKLHLAEFQEFGFRVRFQFSQEFTEAQLKHLMGDFMVNSIEKGGLMFVGGGTLDRWEGFVVLDASRGSATEEHRQLVTEWLESRPEVTEFEVGPLVDAWYGG